MSTMRGQQAAMRSPPTRNDVGEPGTALPPVGDAADQALAGAHMVLAEALAVAASPTLTWSRGYYRDWLVTPSPTLRRALNLTGHDPDHWHRHRVPALLAQWHHAEGDLTVRAAA